MVVDTRSPPIDAITASPAIASRMLRRRRRRPCPGLSTTGTSTPTHSPAASSCRELLQSGADRRRLRLLPRGSGPAQCQLGSGPSGSGIPDSCSRYRDAMRGPDVAQAVVNPPEGRGRDLRPGPGFLACPLALLIPFCWARVRHDLAEIVEE